MKVVDPTDGSRTFPAKVVAQSPCDDVALLALDRASGLKPVKAANSDNVKVGDHVVIQRGTILGSQGGVLPHKVLRPGAEPYWGTPAQPLKKHLRELAALRRLAKKEK